MSLEEDLELSTSYFSNPVNLLCELLEQVANIPLEELWFIATQGGDNLFGFFSLAGLKLD